MGEYIMKISMTSGDIILNVLICIITGIFSGWITGVIVTKHYRKKDENIETSKYLAVLVEYIHNLMKVTFFTGGAIPDEYIVKIHQYTRDHSVPLNYEWIKLNVKEENIVNQAIEVCNFIKDKSFDCQMKIGWMSRDNYPKEGKKALQNDIDDWKLKIFLETQKLSSIYESLFTELRKYIYFAQGHENKNKNS